MLKPGWNNRYSYLKKLFNTEIYVYMSFVFPFENLPFETLFLFELSVQKTVIGYYYHIVSLHAVLISVFKAFTIVSFQWFLQDIKLQIVANAIICTWYNVSAATWNGVCGKFFQIWNEINSIVSVTLIFAFHFIAIKNERKIGVFYKPLTFESHSQHLIKKFKQLRPYCSGESS